MKKSRPAEFSQLYFDQDMTEAELLQVAGGNAAVFSARCPGKESPNEDSAAVIPFDNHSAVLVVADGLGGNAAGELASRITIEAISAAIDEARSSGVLLRTAIINGIEQANTAVQALGTGAATTVAAVEVLDGMVRPYHVGDSSILMFGGRGKIKLHTVSHSPVGYAIEAGVLDASEALYHEDRHLVSNVVGTPEMHIQVGPSIELARLDTVVVATDGLFDNLRLEEIVQHLRKSPLQKTTQQLIQHTQQRMDESSPDHPSKPDDLTAIAYRPTAARKAKK